MNVLENFEPVVKRLLYQGQETSQELINQLFEKNASVVAVVGCIAAVATGTLSLHLAKKVGFEAKKVEGLQNLKPRALGPSKCG